MVENDGMRHIIQRRLRTTTAFVLLLVLVFIAEVWIREALSFRPTLLRRRAATFDKNIFYKRITSSNCNHRQKKRNGFVAATSSVVIESERESEISPPARNSTLPIFDYRRLPPISDTTPCEVIQSIDRNGNINTDYHSNQSFTEREEFYFPSSEELSSLPKGDRGGYHIVREYPIEFGTNIASSALRQSANITLQHALVRLDPKNYPTLTRARKACRKGMVLIHRNRKKKQQNFYNKSDQFFDFQRGNVGDFVVSGDIIGVQMFLGTYRKKQCYPNIEYSRPQFQLPVLYEDDHLAVVNKPAGVAVYSETRNNGSGDKTGNRKTVHFALPFVLTPPKKGTPGGILRRPGIVHRLDKPTSGLLLVAKTKTSMEHLYQQFRERDIQKIYTAIVNGDLMHHQEEYQQETGKERQNNEKIWNFIDYPLGGKHALTSWKILEQSQSLNAKDGVLTMVQVRLHTGRYHQIRRHFAWWCRRPLVGDHLYAGMLQAHHFRKKGLFLSSNGISFLHPVQDDDENSVTRRVEVTIDVPKRFAKLMKAEDTWAKQNSGKEEVPQKS